MKKYVDQFRGKLPPALEGKLPGVLFADMERMKKWRYWGTGPTYIDIDRQIKLIGALDDCLDDKKIFVPLDWKSKGSEPEDDGSQYYQTQLDCYNLMLSHTKIDNIFIEVRDEGWLVYVYPAKAINYPWEEAGLDPQSPIVDVLFGLKPFLLKCDRERAKEIVIKAAECLRGPRPKSSLRCEHCQYLALEDELAFNTAMAIAK